jgi:hypothetical protein
MYAPTVDKMKQMELEITKERLKNPVRPRALARAELSQSHDMVEVRE